MRITDLRAKEEEGNDIILMDIIYLYNMNAPSLPSEASKNRKRVRAPPQENNLLAHRIDAAEGWSPYRATR